MRAIVQRGWLPVIERAAAGSALAVLGDARDFDEFISIPAGEFRMGNDSNDHSKPMHPVRLPAFRIAKFPITNRQYERFVRATQRAWNSPHAHKMEKSNHPACYVSWYDAMDYCAWLTRGNGARPEESVRPTSWPCQAKPNGNARRAVGRAVLPGEAILSEIPHTCNAPCGFVGSFIWLFENSSVQRSAKNRACSAAGGSLPLHPLQRPVIRVSEFRVHGVQSFETRSTSCFRVPIRNSESAATCTKPSIGSFGR
ncbi:MAG: formylglycine-generating enzyme family protein [Methylocella sp.]